MAKNRLSPTLTSVLPMEFYEELPEPLLLPELVSIVLGLLKLVHRCCCNRRSRRSIIKSREEVAPKSVRVSKEVDATDHAYDVIVLQDIDIAKINSRIIDHRDHLGVRAVLTSCASRSRS